MNATVWRGRNDDEPVASAMDEFDHVGKVWITFDQGSDRSRSASFRDNVMREIIRRWPLTMRLPIMPTGAIPLAEDLVPTPRGYKVKASAESRYQLKAPAAAQ